MSRPYETVFIFDSSLEDARVQEKVERLRKIVSGDSADATEVVLWGKRKLAYPLGKREQGNYVILRFACEPAALAEMERVARLDEEIVRHLTIVHPPESHIVGAAPAGAAPAAIAQPAAVPAGEAEGDAEAEAGDENEDEGGEE